MKNILIINTQAFGDCLLGTHTVRLIKQMSPDTNITFAVKNTLRLTTSEEEETPADILSILSKQSGIDNIAVINVSNRQTQIDRIYIIKDNQISEVEISNFDRVIVQDRWFSDLGIVKSQSVALLSDERFHNTETSFTLAKRKKNPTDHIFITTSGPLDWNRKTSNEALRQKTLFGIIEYLKSNNIPARILPIGKDVDNFSLEQALTEINNSHIFIGPMGSLVHAAAGLNTDTIHITSVYPVEYDSPAHYHSGWHRPIKSKIHCQTYACISEKSSEEQVYPEGPKTKYGFWPKMCSVNNGGFSCIYTIQPNQIIDSFIEWYEQKGKLCLNQ